MVGDDHKYLDSTLPGESVAMGDIEHIYYENDDVKIEILSNIGSNMESDPLSR